MKTKNSFTKQLLSIVTCMALILTMLPLSTLTAFAQYEPKFINSDKANHWGRSNLRAYLNNAEKIDNTLRLDSSSYDNSAGYPSQFSNAEIALVQPYTYSTNVLRLYNVTSSYVTTDRFWLPSGNISNDDVISWGENDLSANVNYHNLPATRAIPISYWYSGASHTSWLRSTYGQDDFCPLVTVRGLSVSCNSLTLDSGVAAACKIDLSSVIFASSVSAESVAVLGGSKRSEISGSSYFGKKTEDALPDYGMYLRQMSRDSFEVTGLKYSGTTLTVNYTGGVAGSYVVVQAFKADDLMAGTTSYEAVSKLQFGQTSATLDVQNWGLNSLDGLTVKVWMEDLSDGSSLAKATTPVTFVGTSKTDTGAVKSSRVFAMKDDLQTSWGTLADTTDLVGANPTNQKIYFGKDSSGNPLQFWIAGREAYISGRTPKDGDGEISSTGEIMTLYQANSL